MTSVTPVGCITKLNETWERCHLSWDGIWRNLVSGYRPYGPSYQSEIQQSSGLRRWDRQLSRNVGNQPRNLARGAR
jgi:hypothetical protein